MMTRRNMLLAGQRWRSRFADLTRWRQTARWRRCVPFTMRCLPTPECEVFIASLGGAMTRVAPDAMAWSNRDAHFVMNAHTRWRDPAEDTACIAWARQLLRRHRALRDG